MATELLDLQKRVRSDKWEMLHEISSLEHRLEAERAMRQLQRSAGTSARGEAEAEEAGAEDEMPVVTPASRLEEIAKLHAELTRERGEVIAAVRAVNDQRQELEQQLKRAVEEAASMRGAEAARAAESEERQRELSLVAKDLEEKIGAIRTAARIGADSASATSNIQSKELKELEMIVNAAEDDVSRIEKRLAEPAGGDMSLAELHELRDALSARLAAFDQGAKERELQLVGARKEAAMQAVAQQLVPQMNELQGKYDVKRAEFERLLSDAGGARGLQPEARKELARQMEDAERAHESELGALEKKAAEALAGLEERFEAEMESIETQARGQEVERQRVAARLEGVEARIQGMALFPTTAGAGMAHGETSPLADGAPAKRATSSFAASTKLAGRAGRAAQTSVVIPGSAKACLHRRSGSASASLSLRGVGRRGDAQTLRRWSATASFLAGMTVGGAGGSGAAWAQARAEKVALVRQIDEQAQQLASASDGTRSGRRPGASGEHVDEQNTLRQVARSGNIFQMHSIASALLRTTNRP